MFKKIITKSFDGDDRGESPISHGGMSLRDMRNEIEIMRTEIDHLYELVKQLKEDI